MSGVGRYPSAFLDDLKSRVSLSTLIGRRVTWDRRKTNQRKGDFWACCPAHSEKTPSFHADDRRGAYKCFGCGIGGDAIQWLTEFEGMAFPDAVAELATMAGLPLPESTPESRAAAARKLSLIEANEQAAVFFAEQLRKTPEAMAYVRRRGITAEDVAAFRLGYAPNGNGVLREFGQQESTVEAGLVAVAEDGHPYDRFRHRLMFPITDDRGQVVAFSGRALGDDKAKYLNSPETPVFVKGRVLYNFKDAKARAWDDKPVVVVEGHIDVISASRTGVAACGTMGTALTADHVNLLWRMSPEPVMCFDGDEAGTRAANRTIDLLLPALKEGRTAGFVNLPQGSDPDSLIREKGADFFLKLVANPRPLADALWERETAAGVVNTPERRAALEARLRDAIKKIGDKATRSHYGRDFRDRLFALGRRPGVYRSNGQSNHSTSPAANRLIHGFRRSVGLSLREAILVAAIADAPQAALAMAEQMAADERMSEQAHTLISRLVTVLQDADPAAVAEAIEAAGLSEVVGEAMADAAKAGIAMRIAGGHREAVGVLEAAWKQ